MFEKLTELLDSFLENGIPGYDCVVYHKGECVYRHMNGYSNFENKVTMTGNELYNIYSASKMITCTAALMLWEKGLYDLEDDLSLYLPEFKEMYVRTENGVQKAKNSIKIKNLFCMTAGLTYHLDLPQIKKCQEETEGRCPTRELVRYLAKEPLFFEPGERFEYSLCHDVLAALVEEISGMRFGEFVRQNIFEPLDMKNSTFLLDDSQIEKVSCQYAFDTELKRIVECPKTIMYKLGTEYESGGAGCITTLEDYIKFLEGLRTEKLLKVETIELMSTNQLTDKQLENYWVEGAGYGLGVSCSRKKGDNTDFGWGGAAGAYPIVDLKREISFFYIQHVLNTNCDSRNTPMREYVRKHFFE